ncbi:uncharacterized protein LOC142764837 [Rhipicephalus microplus]|uniref:uncharacterized protein LOC142764837 n=1 Tax=Rhipicephalus microplus TaxID=6941 RepID=UPI003F6D031A
MKTCIGKDLLFAFCSLVFASVQAVSAQDKRDFSDVDTVEMVESVLRKLPHLYTVPNMKPVELILGITFGPVQLKGADIFKFYGPVSKYCRNGARLVQVDIIADHPIDFFTPWKICSVKEGVLGVQRTARVTVTFEVANATASSEPKGERKLVVVGELMPVNTRVNAVYLRGAGEVLQNAVGYSRILLPAISDELWEGAVKFELRKMLQKATEDP